MDIKQTSMYDDGNGLRITLETNQHTVDEVLDGVENVLRGQGYVLKGYIDVVKEEL